MSFYYMFATVEKYFKALQIIFLDWHFEIIILK